MESKTAKKWPFVVGALAVLLAGAAALTFTRAYWVPSYPSPAIIGTTTAAPAAVDNATAVSESGPKPPDGSIAAGWVQDDPSKIDNSKMEITPVDKLHITGNPQDVDIVSYRLRIDGLVSTPLELKYEDILEYPTVTETVLLICPSWFWDNATWTGVPMKRLLAEANYRPEAKTVTFHSIDGYTRDISLSTVLKDGVFLAHTVDGQVLPKEQGFPVRLVVKGENGNSWVKWIDRITVS
jgi:DMSO/TMAO reductase YedYZ molybdopterin-dependent catalytic subunit